MSSSASQLTKLFQKSVVALEEKREREVEEHSQEYSFSVEMLHAGFYFVFLFFLFFFSLFFFFVFLHISLLTRFFLSSSIFLSPTRWMENG